MALLTLTASECARPNHWHWSLHEVDADGHRNQLLAEHDVRLNPADWQHAAWLDLHHYVRLNAAPDRRREEEQRITAEVGAWVGAKVFGPIGTKLVELAGDEAVTVYVTVEPGADKPAGESPWPANRPTAMPNRSSNNSFRQSSPR
jgi:hypothetical protein